MIKSVDRDGMAANDPLLRDADFYPPEDGRLYESGIGDIDGGDSFDDYSRWFWNVYGDDIYDDCNLN